jgi:hypothetical protein
MNNSPTSSFDNVTGPKLTPKQKVFVKEYIDNRGNGTKAALVAYGSEERSITERTAAAVASENLTKPNIIMSLGNYNELIESTLANTVKQWGDSDRPREREIAIDVAKFSHDKIHGRASQAIQLTSTTFNISLDLSGGNAGDIPQHVLDSLSSDK